MAKKICLFNHKGGVGKTTLTFHLAAMLAEMGKVVLLVDADPQCNLTTYVLNEELVDSLLDDSDGVKGRTVWSGVRPIAEALGDIKQIAPLKLVPSNCFLIPGDIQLSEFESELNAYWTESFQRKAKGFRGLSAISSVAASAAKAVKADYIFFDVGPNIGPLNRSVVLDSDFLLIPASCDLFSIRALRTLGKTLCSWIADWQTISAIAPKGAPLLSGLPKILGLIPQGYKIYGGLPTAIHAKHIAQIERRMTTDIINPLKLVDARLVSLLTGDLKAGKVKHFGAQATSSQHMGVPVWNLPGKNGVEDESYFDFKKIADKIVEAGKL